MEINQENDTTNLNPLPFEIENNGNCEVNVSVNASALWTSGLAPLNTDYYQFKANYSTEAGSFDYANSQTTWQDMSDVNKSVLVTLNHTDANDLAYVDIRIDVPLDEPGVAKTSNLIFFAEDTE